MAEKITPPKIVTGFEITPEATQAAYELIAEALRQQTTTLTLTYPDVTYEGKPIGTYEVSVRLVD